MPQANNMDAKHCAQQTIILDSQLKRYLEGLFDGFSCQNKDPGFNLRRNYTLRSHPLSPIETHVVHRPPVLLGK